MKYDVQIRKTKNGPWEWAGVQPVASGESYTALRRRMVKMASDPYWTNVIGAIAFRVRAVPGSGEPQKGPRALAREAQQLTVALRGALDLAIAQRDEARTVVADLASRLGLEVEW